MEYQLPSLPHGYIWAIFGPLPVDYWAVQILKDDYIHGVGHLPLFVQATGSTPQEAIDKAHADFQQRVQDKEIR